MISVGSLMDRISALAARARPAANSPETSVAKVPRRLNMAGTLMGDLGGFSAEFRARAKIKETGS
jgi:hypothetical protein